MKVLKSALRECRSYPRSRPMDRRRQRQTSKSDLTDFEIAEVQ